jgi:Na+-translocating ferredoxin:NAD+ oxidoreductase RnfG subunit
MKKKITALILLLSMILTILTALTSCDLFTNKNDDDVDKTEESEDEIIDNAIKVSKDFREVLPGAKRVIDIKSLIPGLSDLVLEAYEETSGKGYFFIITAEGYKPGMKVLVAIDTNGKITGSKCIATNDTFEKESELDNTYIGQTISNFQPIMITGATMTSSGYADAVLVALQSYILASGEKLDPSVAIEELIPKIAPGFTKLTEIEAPSNVKKAFKVSNDAGFVYIFSNGNTAVLALVNATGHCTIYDINENDVSSDYANIAKDAIAFAAENQTSYFKQLEKKIKNFYSNASEINEVSFTTFNTVVSASEFKSDGNKYYAFYSRSFGFNQMDVYIILDSNGAIAKLDADKFIFEEEYFSAFGGMNTSDYTTGFNGLTENTFTPNTCVIAGATMTSRAIEQSVRDAFDVIQTLNN